MSYLHALYARSSAPLSPDRCGRCDGITKELYRCKSCFESSPLCLTCLMNDHKRHPLHTVQAWTGAFWKDASLAKLGMVLHLGHHGQPCPHANGTSSIWVGDITGFTSLNVSYCCHKKRPSQATQLLQVGLFPCTDDSPQSAFSLLLLEHFAVFGTMGKTSGFRYYSVLKRLTRTGFPAKVPDRYRELLQAHRKYAHLMSLKRSGAMFPPHPNKAYEDTLTIQCVACPNTGVSFNPMDVLPAEMYVSFSSFDNQR